MLKNSFISIFNLLILIGKDGRDGREGKNGEKVHVTRDVVKK